MKEWLLLVSPIYYTGVGAVLLGTTIRFLYRFIRDYDQDREYLKVLREKELPAIKAALDEISRSLDINTRITLSLKPPLLGRED